MVASVKSTPDRVRTWRAMRSAMMAVASRVVPSGARRLISKWASSLSGRKPFFTTFMSGPVAARVSTEASTTTQRWRITQPSRPR